MHYSVLGPLEVRGDTGAALAIRRGRPRSLLHLLLMQRRMVLTTEVVVDRLWQREAPHDGSNAVHQLVSYLRRALGTGGRDQLVTSPVGYRLDAADDQVDAWRFEQLMLAATHGLAIGSGEAVPHALSAAEEAARLWRGDPYPESAEYEWAAADTSRLRESYLHLQETRLEAMLILGRHKEVMLEAQSLAAAYPLREQFHAHRAIALYRSGRQSEALDALRELRRLLDEELALDLSRPLQALEQRILRQDPDLDWTPTGAVEVTRTSAGPPASPAVTVTSPGAAGEPAPADFPVPRTPPRPPRLLGRSGDVERLAGALRPGTLVTLTGLAGVGKSTLARRLGTTWPEVGVWYVELSDVDQADLAPAAIARQLGFSGQLPADPISVLVTAFRDAEGLLVVDTCEHLLPALSTALDRIREAAARLTILATSRRPLGLPEEVIYRLDPLDVPAEGAELDLEELQTFPSLQLFLDRARRVRSDFHLDAGTARDVAEVVRSVEGVPLAIELAAANADVLGAAMIRERITHRPTDAPLTTSGTGRQSSLGAALDASRVLLGDREAQLFLALAAFRGSFGMEGARAVVPEEFGDPYDSLASLVRQSLVVHEGGPTYRLLGPVRVYAADCLETAPDRQAILDRHASYVADVSRVASRELRTSSDALTRLQRLLPDARAAMEWSMATRRLEWSADIAVAYTWYWAINGLAAEGLRWLGAVHGEIDGPAADGEVDPARHAAVLRSMGLLANPMGHVRAARDHCRRAIALSRSCDDEEGMTAALLTLGIAEWAMGDLEAAAHAHDRALEVATSTGHRWHRLSALTLRARTALDAGEPGVEDLLEAAIAAAQDDGEHQMLSISLSLLGRHHLGSGRSSTAEVAAEGALETARSINYREGELSALNLLGRVHLASGLPDRAIQCFMTALSIAAEMDHRGSLCETVESLALASAGAGQHEHAYLLLRASDRERARLGIHLPMSSASAVTEAQVTTAEVLGSAAARVDTRVKFLRFDELVRELLHRDR